MKHNVQLLPSAIEFQASDTSPVLESALSAGVHIAFGCRDGNCGTCKAKVISGTVTQPDDLPGLSSLERAAGYILSCRSIPCSSLVLETYYYPQLAVLEQRVLPCKVESFCFPAADVAIVKLRLPPGHSFEYLPGQYIDLITGPVRRSYSIANSVHEYDGIELHIRRIAGGKFSELVFGQLQHDRLLWLEGPSGTFFVRDTQAPIIFLAGGTGFAPVKSMIMQLLEDNTQRELYIYWGAKESTGFYSGLPQQWQNSCSNVHYNPVLSSDDSDWSGRRGLVHKAVLEDFSDLSGHEIYACGSPAMIDAARNEFIATGAKPDKFFCDKFSPSS